MATFIYRSTDGSTVEVCHPMRSAPAIGARIRRNGKTYRRVLSLGQQTRKEFKPYVSHSMNRNVPGFKTDSEGRCVVETRAQERDYGKAMGYEWR